MAIGLFFRCIFGPRLYRIYRTTDEEGRLYTANVLEGYSDSIIKSLSLAWSITVYTSPLLISVLYRRGYYSFEGALSLGRLAGVLSLLLLGTLCLRSIGRCTNNNYMTFLTLLERAQENMTKGNKIALSRYDFDFYAWPVEFAWNTTEDDKEKPKLYLTNKTQFKRGTVFENIKGLPCQILSYLAIHSFGRRMIYPGTVKLLQSSVSQFLFQGRARLVEEHGAERYKLLARDGNEIDTVIVDRRRKSEFTHGKTLVICCEGNAGFYEYGVMGTPLEGGYSVLGWNHPGFAGSTGVPFPRNEENAIDVVIQFAVHKLQFKVEDIVIYAWSIGGYPATWAAMNYPDIKGLILDATFDDLLPLATARMPPSWKPLVTRTIKEYMNLNNGWQLCNYLGPVLLIRRTQDEMISTRETSPIATNRGNILLTKLLQCRYPKLLTEDTAWALKEWLAGDSAHQVILQSQQCVEEDLCLATLQSCVEEHSSSFPMHIGEGMSLNSRIQLLLFLASKHMAEFDSTHCSPLPAGLFQMPWKLEGANECSLPMNNTCPLPKDCNL